MRARAVLPEREREVVRTVRTSSERLVSSAFRPPKTSRTSRFRRAPTGRSCSFRRREGEARVFELATGRRLARLRPGARLDDAVFSPDGKSVSPATPTASSFAGMSAPAPGSHVPFTARPSVRLAVSPDGGLSLRPRGRRRASGSPPTALLSTAAAPGLGRRGLLRPLRAQLYDAGARRPALRTRDWGGRRSCSTSRGRSRRRSSLRSGDLVATGGRDDLAMIWDTRDGRHGISSLAHRGDYSTWRGRRTADLLATASSG